MIDLNYITKAKQDTWKEIFSIILTTLEKIT